MLRVFEFYFSICSHKQSISLHCSIGKCFTIIYTCIKQVYFIDFRLNYGQVPSERSGHSLENVQTTRVLSNVRSERDEVVRHKRVPTVPGDRAGRGAVRVRVQLAGLFRRDGRHHQRGGLFHDRQRQHLPLPVQLEGDRVLLPRAGHLAAVRRGAHTVFDEPEVPPTRRGHTAQAPVRHHQGDRRVLRAVPRAGRPVDVHPDRVELDHENAREREPTAPERDQLALSHTGRHVQPPLRPVPRPRDHHGIVSDVRHADDRRVLDVVRMGHNSAIRSAHQGVRDVRQQQ